MSNKRLLLFFGIFILLLVAAFSNLWFPKMLSLLGKDSQKTSEINFKPYTEEFVDKVVISGGSGEVVLVKAADGWYIGDKKASGQVVSSLFENFSALSVVGLISKNIANQGQYGFDGREFSLKVTYKGVEYSYLVGVEGENYGTFYIKKDGSDMVYLADGLLKYKLNQGASFWRDKTVLNIKQESLTQVKLTGKRTVVLSKGSDGKWGATGVPATLVKDNYASVAAFVSPLVASDFAGADSVSSYSKAKSYTVATITFDDSDVGVSGVPGSKLVSPVTLTAIKSGDTYLAKVSGSEELYVLSDPVIKDLFKLVE